MSVSFDLFITPNLDTNEGPNGYLVLTPTLEGLDGVDFSPSNYFAFLSTVIGESPILGEVNNAGR